MDVVALERNRKLSTSFYDLSNGDTADDLGQLKLSFQLLEISTLTY